MSIIVEDGSIVAGAESYISITDALTYHNKRGNDLWATITTQQQEQALVRATDYMVARYRKRWKGARVTLQQTLDWPRTGVVRDEANETAFAPGAYGAFVIPYTEVPVEVKNACAELAYRASQGPLAEDAPFGRIVTQETVGPITVKYDNSGVYQPATYKQVDMSLSILLSTSSSGPMVKLNRV